MFKRNITSFSLPTTDSMFCFHQPPWVGHILLGTSKWREEQGTSEVPPWVIPSHIVQVPTKGSSPFPRSGVPEVSSPLERTGLSFSFSPPFPCDLTPLCVAKIPHPTASSSQDLHPVGAELSMDPSWIMVDFFCLRFFSLEHLGKEGGSCH